MFKVNQLVGFGAGGGLKTLTQVLSATSVNLATITAPVGIQAGDLIVMLDSPSALGIPPTAVVPTGFTSIVNTSATIGGTVGMRMICSYKIAVGTEGGTSITGMDGSTADDKVILVFRGNIPITTITPADTDGAMIGTDPVAQTVTASGGASPLIVFGAYSSTNTIDPRTFTVAGVAAKDGEVNSSNFNYLAWKIYNSAPADVVIDMDDEGTAMGMQSFYLQAA